MAESSKSRSRQCFNIGDEIDVYDTERNIWRVSEIRGFRKPNLITTVTRTKPSDQPSRKMIPKGSSSIAALHTHTLPRTNLTCLAGGFCKEYTYCGHVRPVLYNKTFIILTEYHIWGYDVKTDTFRSICSSNNVHSPVGFSVVDQKNGLLIITRPQKRSSLTFIDLKTNKSSTMDGYMRREIGCPIRKHYAVVINHDDSDNCKCYSNGYSNGYQDKDVLHILAFMSSTVIHAYYNKKSQQFVRLQTIHSVDDGGCVYIEHEKRILLFADDDIYEFYGNISTGNEARFVQSRICLPTDWTKFTIYRIMNIFQTLIVFVVGCNQVLFLDLIKNKWFRRKTNYEIIPVTTQIIDGKDNYVYLMRYERCFYKLHWMDIIPDKLCTFYKDINYRKLIHRYCANNETANNINVPFCLKELILLYFPSFLHPV
eukprot:97183_1